MATTAASYTTDYKAECPLSRRCSTETVLSVQDRETDYARDTSDSEPFETDSEAELEPVTNSEQEEVPFDFDTADSDDNIIKTEILAMSVGDDGDLQLADSELTDSHESDTEFIRHDFVLCAQCKAPNNNSTYRYCNKCFIMRKNFFPPRPRRHKKSKKSSEKLTQLSETRSIGSQGTDGGYYSLSSQSSADTVTSGPDTVTSSESHNVRKRRGSHYDHAPHKRRRSDTGSATDADEPARLDTVSVKSLSQTGPVKLTKKSIAATVLEKMDAKELCVVCVTEPKSGVFVHGRIGHICCCYRCAVKVWSTARRCPVCNCRVSNVLKAVVM